MLGDVFEWVNDWCSDTYYASSPSTNPPGPASGSNCVLRGGSRIVNSYYLRSSARYNGNSPGYTDDSLGFRVARAPSEFPFLSFLFPLLFLLLPFWATSAMTTSKVPNPSQHIVSFPAGAEGAEKSRIGRGPGLRVARNP